MTADPNRADPAAVQPPGTLAAEVIAAWDAELARIPDSGAWAQATLADVMARGFIHDGQPTIRVARPNFVEVGQTRNDQAVVAAATRALVGAVDLALGDPGLSVRCFGSMVSPAMRPLFDLPQDYGHAIMFGRFDGARQDSGVQILEFNGGLPGGLTGSDWSAEVMRGWPPFAAVSEQFDLQIPDLGQVMVQAMIQTWHGFGGAGLPRVALAVPAELRGLTRSQVSYLVYNCARAGVTCREADPGELKRSGGALRLDGEPVDLVIRVFFTTMLARLGPRIADLIEAVAAREVAMMTSFRSGLYGHKAMFALATDPAVDLGLSREDAELVRAHLPWSRMLGTTRTTGPDGLAIDLDAYAIAAREELVLKPADGTGGAGVVLGWTVEPAAWEAALKSARDSGGVWILQSRIELTQQSFPFLEAGFPQVPVVVDHNPLVINDQVAGYFTRMSPVGQVTNLTSGGSLAPTFFVAGRLR